GLAPRAADERARGGGGADLDPPDLRWPDAVPEEGAESAPVEGALAALEPDRCEPGRQTPAPETDRGGFETGVERAGELRAVEPQELCDPAGAPEMLLRGGGAGERHPSTVDAPPPVTRDVAVRVRHAGGQWQVVDEPGAVPCRTHRRCETEVPRDGVAA